MQGVHDRPGDVGMAGGVRPRGAEGDLTAAGSTALDGQEGGSDVGPARVPLDATGLDDILGFEHQGRFRLQAVMDLLGAWIEVAHQVVHPDPNTGRIDPDVLDIEALGELLDLGGLVGERLPPPGILFQDPELATWFIGWRNDHTRCVVSGTAWVIAQPHRPIPKRTLRGRVVVLPLAKVGIAAFEVGEAEHRLSTVDEFAHEQLLEAFFVVLQTQAIDVEQIAAAGDGIFQSDDLAPLAIRTECARVNLRLAGPYTCFLSAFTVAERLTRPEGVRLMGNCTGRGEVGLSPLRMSRHTTGYALDFVEARDPEDLIDVEVTVVALRGIRIGGQEAQLSPGLTIFAQDDGVPGQFDIEPLASEGHDVAAENL